MGGLLGQTPWAMLNQLTERNMALWKDFQQNLGNGLGSATAPPPDKDKGARKPR
jgi:hypothetical protein